MPSRDRVLSLLGCAGLLLGCAPLGVTGTSAKAEHVQPALFVEAEVERGLELVEDRSTCPKGEFDESSLLFDGQIALSLPLGLDRNQVEAGGGVARWLAPATCFRTEAQVALLTYNLDPAHPATMVEWHRHLFELLEFPSEREVGRVAGRFGGEDLTVVVGFPGDSQWGETQAYLRILVRDSRLVALVYMTDRDGWAAWEPSFAESARSLALRSVDPAGRPRG